MKIIAIALLALALVLAFGRAIDAATDPAVPACAQATLEGAYTLDLYDQCLDDYHDVDAP